MPFLACLHAFGRFLSSWVDALIHLCRCFTALTSKNSLRCLATSPFLAEFSEALDELGLLDHLILQLVQDPAAEPAIRNRFRAIYGHLWPCYGHFRAILIHLRSTKSLTKYCRMMAGGPSNSSGGARPASSWAWSQSATKGAEMVLRPRFTSLCSKPKEVPSLLALVSCEPRRAEEGRISKMLNLIITKIGFGWIWETGEPGSSNSHRNFWVACSVVIGSFFWATS